MPHEYRRRRSLPQGHRDARGGVTAVVANWIHALYDRPVVYGVAYPLWMVHGIAICLLFGLTGRWVTVSDRLAWPTIMAAALVFGALSIILSRPLAEGRNSMPTWIRYLDEGRYGFVDYGPWVFRLSGSGSVGLAFGVLTWIIASSVTAAVVVGFGVGLAVWIWTWFLFPEIEE